MIANPVARVALRDETGTIEVARARVSETGMTARAARGRRSVRVPSRPVEHPLARPDFAGQRHRINPRCPSSFRALRSMFGADIWPKECWHPRALTALDRASLASSHYSPIPNVVSISAARCSYVQWVRTNSCIAWRVCSRLTGLFNHQSISNLSISQSPGFQSNPG